MAEMPFIKRFSSLSQGYVHLPSSLFAVARNAAVKGDFFGGVGGESNK